MPIFYSRNNTIEAFFGFASKLRLTLVRTMPSLPPRDGVVAPPSAGIRAGASTVSADATFNSDVGTSLPSPPMGEHDAFGGSSGGTFLVRRPSKKKIAIFGI